MTRACHSEAALASEPIGPRDADTHRKRVLTVVSSFCPAMTPDMQRGAFCATNCRRRAGTSRF